MSAAFDARQRALVADAAAWRLVALLFERPRQGWHAQLAALAAEIPDPDLRAAARQAAAEASEGLYHSTFKPGGPASLREVACRDAVELGGLMAELESLYEAFAYRPDSDEPADHVALEAGFLSYLRLKEVYALASGDEERAALTRETARRFCADHLQPLARRLAGVLAGCGISCFEQASRALVRLAETDL